MKPKHPQQPRDLRKFLFDVHNFDEPEEDDIVEEEEEDLPPPPPSFSEEELEAARIAAYDKGKADGMAEALNSIEMQIAETLGIIRENFNIIFDAEDRRNHIFEKEAVQLSSALITHVFPILNEAYGLEGVKKTITDALDIMREQPELVIDAPPAYAEAIQLHLDGILRIEDTIRCTVRGNDTLETGECRITWHNGMAIRDPKALIKEIQEKIEHLLADRAKLTDNETADAPPPSGNTESGIENGDSE